MCWSSVLSEGDLSFGRLSFIGARKDEVKCLAEFDAKVPVVVLLECGVVCSLSPNMWTHHRAV
jgi:hypothetical protein